MNREPSVHSCCASSMGTATAEGESSTATGENVAAFDRLPVQRGLAPMEAKLVDELRKAPAGLRAEMGRVSLPCVPCGDEVALQSKSGKPLARYFPEVVEAILRLFDDRFVVDGELIIPTGSVVVRRAPDAASPRREPDQELAASTPAQLMLFDCLLSSKGRNLVDGCSPSGAKRWSNSSRPRRRGAAAFAYTEDRALAQACSTAPEGPWTESSRARRRPLRGRRACDAEDQAAAHRRLRGRRIPLRRQRRPGGLASARACTTTRVRSNHVGFTSGIRRASGPR
jgi:hypothetical protein